MSKIKKILCLIVLVFLILLTVVFYGILEMVKSKQCEKEAFGSPEFEGGDEYRELFYDCMKEKNIIELLKKDMDRSNIGEKGDIL